MSKVRNENFDMVTKTLKGIRCTDQVIHPLVEALRCLCEGEEINIPGQIGQKAAAEIEDQKGLDNT